MLRNGSSVHHWIPLILTRWGNQIAACFYWMGNGRTASGSDMPHPPLWETREGLALVGEGVEDQLPACLTDAIPGVRRLVVEPDHWCLLPLDRRWKISCLMALSTPPSWGIRAGHLLFEVAHCLAPLNCRGGRRLYAVFCWCFAKVGQVGSQKLPLRLSFYWCFG